MNKGLPLRIENLAVLGAAGRKLIEIPSLSVEAGEAVAIRGPSGAGKSTLLFALAGLQAQTEGRVIWDGVDLLSLSRASDLLSHLGVPETARQVGTLSGGERQRVSVARALAGDPGVILADEPTASLDRRAADALITDLVALARDQSRTLIAVSHDTALHDAADRVVDIEHGRLTHA